MPATIARRLPRGRHRSGFQAAAHNLSGIPLAWQTNVPIVLGPGFVFSLQKTARSPMLDDASAPITAPSS